jgi:hypothetical protein
MAGGPSVTDLLRPSSRGDGEALGVSPETMMRDRPLARLWRHREMEGVAR